MMLVKQDLVYMKKAKSINQKAQDNSFYELEHNIDNYKHIYTPLTVINEIKILEKTGFINISSSETDRSDYSLIKSRKGE